MRWTEQVLREREEGEEEEVNEIGRRELVGGLERKQDSKSEQLNFGPIYGGIYEERRRAERFSHLDRR